MTTMTEQTTQVYSVFIRATPEQVWEGITKPEFTQRYFYGSVFDTTWEPGSALAGWAADRSQQFVDGEILEVEPPHKLVTTWRALYDPETAAEPPSRVTWEIEQAGEQVTKLTVVHDRLEAAPKTAESVSGGWSYVLSGLKTLLETGEPLGA
ncbi:MAG TPA: SRPBCC family protein [Gaiellaceae bacterium]|nr:SRPBCC family protein [Gaiellaceae bacterium]